MSEISLSKADSRLFDDDICSKYLCDLKHDMGMWPLLSMVPPSLRATINLVYVFGQFGAEMIFTTTDNKVRHMSYDSQKVKIRH